MHFHYVSHTISMLFQTTKTLNVILMLRFWSKLILKEKGQKQAIHNWLHYLICSLSVISICLKQCTEHTQQFNVQAIQLQCTQTQQHTLERGGGGYIDTNLSLNTIQKWNIAWKLESSGLDCIDPKWSIEWKNKQTNKHQKTSISIHIDVGYVLPSLD